MQTIDTADTSTPHPTSSTPPWTRETCPDAMVTLPTPVRVRALDAANELLGEGLDPEAAIEEAVANAWTAKRSAPHHDHDPERFPGPARFLFPLGEHWIVREVGTGTVARLAGFELALQRAAELASDDNGAIFVFVDPKAPDSVICFSGAATAEPGPFHLARRADGWTLSRIALDRSVYRRFETRRDALETALGAAKAARSLLIVHDQAGNVALERDFRPC